MTFRGKPVQIKYIPFPEAVAGNGITIETKTGGYLIVIDSQRTPLQQKITLGHELAHVYLNHLEQHERNIIEIEAEARENAWNFYCRYAAGTLEDS